MRDSLAGWTDLWSLEPTTLILSIICVKRTKVDYGLGTPVADEFCSNGQRVSVDYTGVSVASYSILSGENIDMTISPLPAKIFKKFDFRDPRKISEPTTV